MEEGVSGTKRKNRRYSEEFRRAAVERMRSCDSVVGLARELGIGWRLLYLWRERFETAARTAEETQSAGEAELRAEIARLKAALADRVLEADFFRGALQKIEARSQNKDVSGQTASTSKSGR
jgi:transposase-like protein